MKKTSKKRNILIMKAAALGDVLRTTPIMHRFKNDNVTWLTSEKGFPLLANNFYIKRICGVSFVVET